MASNAENLEPVLEKGILQFVVADWLTNKAEHPKHILDVDALKLALFLLGK